MTIVLASVHKPYLDEVFISVDCESNGKCPGKNSMLSLGAVACDRDGHFLGQFYRTLVPVIGSVEDPETMEWWKKFPEAYAAATKDPEEIFEVMKDFKAWIDQLPGYKKTMVARPSGFDFSMVYWYFHTFLGECPFKYHCLDVQSYAAATLKRAYHEAGKINWPFAWTSKYPHNHNALSDASPRPEGEGQG